MNDQSRPGPLTLVAVLAVGVTSISFGSILVRLSQQADSMVIAFYRMFFAVLLLLPFYLRSRSAAPGPVSAPAWLGVAGLSLALHFAFWIASLRYTSVAVSVLLVNTSPVLVALLSRLFLGESLALRGWLGLLLAFLGSGVLLWNDVQTLGEWRGGSLALLGAGALGLYLIAGRRIRLEAALLQYVYPTCLISAALLGLLVALRGDPLTGYSGQTFLFLFLLALVPQCLGHTSYNWALKYLSATLVSVLVLAEPLLASLLAYWILGEKVGGILALGGLAVGAGIYLVASSAPRPD